MPETWTVISKVGLAVCLILVLERLGMVCLPRLLIFDYLDNGFLGELRGELNCTDSTGQRVQSFPELLSTETGRWREMNTTVPYFLPGNSRSKSSEAWFNATCNCKDGLRPCSICTRLSYV